MLIQGRAAVAALVLGIVACNRPPDETVGPKQEGETVRVSDGSRPVAFEPRLARDASGWAVAWEEESPGGTAVLAATIAADGTPGAPTVIQPATSGDVGIAAAPDGFGIYWRDIDAEGDDQIHFARLGEPDKSFQLTEVVEKISAGGFDVAHDGQTWRLAACYEGCSSGWCFGHATFGAGGEKVLDDAALVDLTSVSLYDCYGMRLLAGDGGAWLVVGAQPNDGDDFVRLWRVGDGTDPFSSGIDVAPGDAVAFIDALRHDNELVVAYYSIHREIFALRRYDLQGKPIGGELLLSKHAQGGAGTVGAAYSHSYFTGTAGWQLFVRSYDANGTARNEPLEIRTNGSVRSYQPQAELDGVLGMVFVDDEPGTDPKSQLYFARVSGL